MRDPYINISACLMINARINNDNSYNDVKLITILCKYW